MQTVWRRLPWYNDEESEIDQDKLVYLRVVITADIPSAGACVQNLAQGWLAHLCDSVRRFASRTGRLTKEGSW